MSLPSLDTTSFVSLELGRRSQPFVAVAGRGGNRHENKAPSGSIAHENRKVVEDFHS